jgi:hypothetical protein
MDSTSIANSNIQGDIAPSLLDMMAKYNPTKYAEVMQKTDDGIKVDGINKANERIYNKSTGQKTETISKSEEALNDIEKIIKSDKPSIRDLRQKYLLDNQKIKD